MKFQTGVIGAGVVGLAIARKLAKKGHEVIILESAAMIGSMTSSRNSEVIHAGIYYPYSSLKRELSVKGRKLLYEYCASRHVEHRKCGKIIVATTQKEKQEDLQKLYNQGKQNGVTDLVLLTKDDVLRIEPHIICEGGILSPSTGIIDSHGLMMSLLAEAEEYGAILSLHSAVKGGTINPDGSIRLYVDDGTDILFQNVINCAGLFAHQIANSITIPTQDCNNKNKKKICYKRQYFAKGNYFKLKSSYKNVSFERLVYPIPEKGGLGVHATIDLAGQIRFGPDVEWIDPNHEITTTLTPSPKTSIDYTVDLERANSFYPLIRKYWPHLKDGDLEPDYSGVRPKLLHPLIHSSYGNNDFLIDQPTKHLVNLLGIESPGLTSCLALADKVYSVIQ